MNATRSIVCIAVLVVAATGGADNTRAQATDDSTYAAHHPSILFTTAELPALRAKVADGGEDDDAFDFIRSLAHSSYVNWLPQRFFSNVNDLYSIPNLGLALWIDEPFDSTLEAAGRNAVLYLAANNGPDYDEGSTGVRLRALVLGYDLFFTGATEAQRQMVLDEIAGYLSIITGTFQYEVFAYRPYLGNHSAMFAGPLGMAAVSLRGELDDPLLDEALADADRIVDRLAAYQFDPDGAYKEGAFYSLWTMENLVFYFHARRRFDGFDYATLAPLRNVEKALAYELLPEGFGLTNNLNDSNYATIPFSLNTACFDWAIDSWDSGLSAWIWEHVAGEYGVDRRASADKAATVLWHRPVAPIQPDSILPHHFLWRDRGLYYYRTGWQSGARSNDVLFSFYSGKFHGGHAQEDQNQFTFYAYGDKYAVDHGSGGLGPQSEAHNMVFVDGAGQHNAGAAIGTDGEIVSDMLSEFADYLVGDATAAYSTYSEFNAPDKPFPGIDWSWGYHGANPVLYARRTILVVHGPGTPYVMIMDDIDKDGAPHDYAWRLHTSWRNDVDAGADPVVIDGDSSSLELHVLNPPFASLTASVADFDNGTSEPDSRLLSLATTAVDPAFAFLLLPSPHGGAPAAVTRADLGWGQGVTIDRGGGVRDVIVRNPAGATALYAGLATDATLAVVHADAAGATGFFALDATALAFAGATLAECANGLLTCALWDGVVDISRNNADYRVADIGVERVRYRSLDLGFARDDGYVVPDGVSAADPGTPSPAALAVRVFPNPFNPSTTVRIRATGAIVAVTVFDVAGRRVRALWRGRLDGVRDLRWDGRNDDGHRVASGAYIVRVRAGDRTTAAKMILMK